MRRARLTVSVRAGTSCGTSRCQHEERRYADSGDVFGRRGYRRAGGYPSADNSVDTIVSHLSDVGTVRYEMGYAAAISVFLFAMMAVTRVVVGKIMDSLGK